MLAARIVSDLDKHDHLCFVHDGDADVRQVLGQYVVAGLERRERVCVYTTPGAASAMVEADLRGVGVPVDALVVDGALVFGIAAQAYLAGGVFDAGRRLDAYAGAARSAIAAGYTGLRAYADTDFLLDRPDTLAAWLGYELRADSLVRQLPLTAMCGYDARRWTDSNLTLAEAVHTRRSRNHATFRLGAGRDGALRLSGEIDLFVANALYRLLVKTAPSRATGVLDVSEVEFIDVRGARSLGTACEAIAGRYGPTVLRGATPLLRKIWKLASWHEAFPHVTLED